MTSTNVEFNKEKAGEYDDHPMVKSFPPIFQKLLNSWDWYKSTPQPLTVLDYGAGTGLNTLEFAKQGHIVTAADVSPHMLDVLRGKLESSPLKDSVTLVQVPPLSEDGWSNALPTDHFDVIFMIAVLHHVAADQQQDLIANLSKLLKTGGRLCVIEFDDSERSREARASFHQKRDEHQHGDPHDHTQHHDHHHDHNHHDHHDHGHQEHGHQEHKEHGHTPHGHDEHGHKEHGHKEHGHKEHGIEHNHHEHGHHHAHDWLTRDTLASYLQHGGLTASQAQLFEVPFDNGTVLDCFCTIGTRDS